MSNGFGVRSGSPADVLSGRYGPRASCLKCSAVLVFPGGLGLGAVASAAAPAMVKELLGSFCSTVALTRQTTQNLPETRRCTTSQAQTSSQRSRHPYYQCASQPASIISSSHPSSPSARGHCNCPIKTWPGQNSLKSIPAKRV